HYPGAGRQDLDHLAQRLQGLRNFAYERVRKFQHEEPVSGYQHAHCRRTEQCRSSCSIANMAGPWSLDKLAAIAGETKDYLRWCVDSGLLHRQPDGDFDPDSLHRLRLIQFARTRGVSDQQLAATTSRQGDLLGVFEELTQPGDAAVNLADTARE